MLAMRVPRPPKLVPMTSDAPSSVKADSSMAAGTLLIIWEAITAVRTGLRPTMADRYSVTAPIRPIFPIRIKKNTKVRRRA